MKVSKEKPKSKKLKELKEEFNNLSKKLTVQRTFYKKVLKGLNVTPSSEKYTEETKDCAKELLESTAKFLKDLRDLKRKASGKRAHNFKPRLCDRKLTDFLSKHFQVDFPELGKYGVCDLNSLTPALLSKYVKDKSLGGTKGDAQIFRLDKDLYNLFNSYSINNDKKTYITLIQERIEELKKDRKVTKKAHAFLSIDKDGTVNMNYSAARIGIPKFGKDYDLPDPEPFKKELIKITEILKPELESKDEEEEDE